MTDGLNLSDAGPCGMTPIWPAMYFYERHFWLHAVCQMRVLIAGFSLWSPQYTQEVTLPPYGYIPSDK